MKNILYILILLCVNLCLIAQEPELVSDFYPGTESGFNSTLSEKIDGRIVLPITSPDLGQELGVIDNGNVSILLDINEGEEWSAPRWFVKFNDKVYFTALSESAGGSIWSTDGTQDGTILEVSFDNSNTRPVALQVAASGKLYFVWDDIIYVGDGDSFEAIFEGFEYEFSSEHQSSNITTYRDEIAFLNREGDQFQLYQIINNEVVSLADPLPENFVSDIFGLTEVSEGLIFGIQDFSDEDLNGTYVLSEQNNSIQKYRIENEDFRRIHPFTKEQALVWVGGKGYYTVNGQQEELLYSTDNIVFTQGQSVLRGIYENNMVFWVTEGNFGDDFILYSDGTQSGTSVLIESSEHLSNFIVQDHFTFFATDVSNGFMPELHYVDMTNGAIETIYSFEQPAVNTFAILPVSVQNNKLFFLSNLDESIGRELYSIDLDIDVSTAEINSIKPEFKFAFDGFEIVSKENQSAKIYIYDISGKLVETSNLMTNTTYSISHLNGAYSVLVRMNDSNLVEKFIHFK